MLMTHVILVSISTQMSPQTEDAFVDLAQGRFGPFRAHVPTKVPLWAVSWLKTRRRHADFEEDMLRFKAT